MRFERIILVTFLANYIINSVIAGILTPILPTSATKSIISPQYVIYAVISALFVGVVAWWLLRRQAPRTMYAGATIGVIGFCVSIISTFVSLISSALLQTASFGQSFGIIPNFASSLFNWGTLVLLAVWLIPAVLVGYLLMTQQEKK